jgi:two-component system sensor histidine kinase KdpD
MRRAARISSRRAGGEWMALYVTQEDGLTGISPDRLAELRARTEDMGGTFHTVVGDSTASAILDFARAENVSQIIIGASRRGRISTLLRPGIGERVIDGSGEIDVLVVTHDFAGRGRAGPRLPREHVGRRRLVLGYVFGVLAPVVVSLLLWRTDDLHGLPTEAMVLMLVVVFTALIGGLVPAIISAVGSGLLLNYLFTPPLYAWTVADPENAFAILLFVVVGIAVSSVVDRAARIADQARKARAEADALTVLSHSLLNASNDLAGLLGSASELFGASGAAILRRGADGSEEIIASHGHTPRTGTDTCEADIDDDSVLVVASPRLTASQRRLLKAYAVYAKVMTERTLAAEANLERLRLADVDRTRTALLAAVSHDLRTPLATIRAAVDGLRSEEVTWSPEDEAELLGTVDEATTRLTALVDNLLDMSRIHTGAITASITEVGLASAVRNAIYPTDGADRIDIDIDPELVVLADPGLLDRVLGNICDNAVKYTPRGAAIRIDAARNNGRVTVRIADSGPGLRHIDTDRLFAPFQRLGDVPRQDGVGLGLAVAKGFTEAMGGTITAEDTPGGGLTLVLEYPAAPSVPELEVCDDALPS